MGKLLGAGAMRYHILAGCLLVCGAAGAFPREPEPGTTTWGYIEGIEGLAATLDDGTVLRLSHKTQVIKLDGSPGTLADVVQNVKAVAQIADDGTVARLELFRRPNWRETYLATMGTAGANTVSVTVDDQVHPRSLALLRASFAYRNQYTRAFLEGDVTYRPEKGETPPARARFSILGNDGRLCFERSLGANEAAHFRINFGQGDRTFVLLAQPEGQGTLRPQWCLWLDPRFASGPTAPAGGFSIYQNTTRQLLEGLRKALGEATVEKVAISQFGNIRVSDSRALEQLQEDLVVLGAQTFDLVGKYKGRVELGNPLSDGQKDELEKLGVKYLLVGTVSDRGDLVVVNAALVNASSNEVVATARATQ